MTISQSKEVCWCPPLLTQYLQILISMYVGLDDSLIMIFSTESLDTTTASVLLLWYSYHIMVLFYDAASSPPRPCLIFFLPALIIRRPPSAACHLPPVIPCQLLLQNSLPNQVDCCNCHRPLPLHRSPPHRLTHCIVCRLPSTQ